MIDVANEALSQLENETHEDIPSGDAGPMQYFLVVEQGYSQSFLKGRGMTLDHAIDWAMRTLPTPEVMEEQWARVAWDACVWHGNRLVAYIQASETAGVPHRIVRLGPPPGAGDAEGTAITAEAIEAGPGIAQRRR